jgi:hypothetical protein
MRRVLLTAACVGMLAGMPARAETWPEHGYYHVEDGWFDGVRFCRLRVELVVDGAIFAFILRENPDGSLLVQFLTQDARVPNAEIVRVGIDREEVFHFTPERRDASPELPSVVAGIRDGAEGRRIVERLRDAAQGARWFQIVALPYSKAVPAAGLREAMDDLAACRTVRRL